MAIRPLLKTRIPSLSRKMHIDYIPMRWGHGDNYCYVLADDPTKKAWIIDPAEPQEVIPEVEKRFADLDFVAVVNTHHHYDHAGGNKALVDHFKKTQKSELPVIAGHDLPHVLKTPSHLEKLKLGDNVTITALHTPCHTQDSICWYAEDTKTGQKALFLGDTIFHLGNGRFFEGTGEEMTEIITKIIPEHVDRKTSIYPGHEYTASNAKFARSVLPSSKALADYIKRFQGKKFTCGLFTLEDEQAANPFFRLGDPEILDATKGKNKSEAEVMSELRNMKNSF